MTVAARHLDEYVRALNTHDWKQLRPLIDDNAVFIFSEGTYVGIRAIEDAMQRTFALIKDEHYQVMNQRWSQDLAASALCYYDFAWRGKIDGREVSGGGRGTSVLHQTPAGWKIIHEHLGPTARS
jgi:ketosteroid isomerase-like protein